MPLANVVAKRSTSHLARRTIARVDSRHASIAAVTDLNAESKRGWLYIDSVFPVRLGIWDIRHYIGLFREETLLARVHSILSAVKEHDFHVVQVDPHIKEGGVFVQFKYNGSEDALEAIEDKLREEAKKKGGVPSWTGINRGNLWVVKGQPWKEDLNRYASPLITVSFEGPDISEERLYSIFRPYGRLNDISPPAPATPSPLRASTLSYRKISPATIARNVLHGLRVDNGDKVTRLRIAYREPIQAHVFRDWIASHPRIVMPVVVFLLGSLTYTIFDPIRAFMVEGKVMDRFDYKESKLYKWLRENTVERFAFSGSDSPEGGATAQVHAWKEREDAEEGIRRYLSDVPSSVMFIHGPQGSGKSTLIKRIIRDFRRKSITIDCTELTKAGSDSALIAALARQTGYWPIFTFMNSINNMIDMASVGLIGQKAGLSTSITDQVKQVLEVSGTAMKSVTASYRASLAKQVKAKELAEQRREEEERTLRKIKEGRWHDGRLDCVAGNGVMSELGVGDEWMDAERDADPVKDISEHEGSDVQGDSAGKQTEKKELERKQKNVADVQAVEALPVVIMKHFESRGDGKEEVMQVLAQWAAALASNQVAHVIVISDNRENAKLLAKASPTKPLNTIELHDADPTSALAFVKQKLQDLGLNTNFTPEQTAYLQRLGGRASDLESLVHKVRNGQRVDEAVEDIISRSVGELRKNAFGDDADDAKNLSWSREQAWTVLKRLSNKPEMSYHDVLMDFPFKGDESALRDMEHAEMISISTQNGRPATVRPGRPVYKWVFERLVNDSVFRATQDINFNEKVIAASESIVRKCEEELLTLKQLGSDPNHWFESLSASSQRAAYLFKKMQDAESKIEALEKQNEQLKKIITKQSTK